MPRRCEAGLANPCAEVHWLRPVGLVAQLARRGCGSTAAACLGAAGLGHSRHWGSVLLSLVPAYKGWRRFLVLLECSSSMEL